MDTDQLSDTVNFWTKNGYFQ